jgi:putative transcriptional regulator
MSRQPRPTVSKVRRNPVTASRVKQLREEAGLGLREAAAFIGVSPSTLSRVENGKAPDIHSAILIARFYETTVEELWAAEVPHV